MTTISALCGSHKLQGHTAQEDNNQEWRHNWPVTHQASYSLTHTHTDPVGETDYLFYQPPTSVLTSALTGGEAVIDLPTHTGARA